MIKRFALLLLLAASVKIFAQGELPVDINTGRPIITIPLTTISSHELSDDISLSYDASGIRVQQPSGNFGIGWNLTAGGSIRREVRSLPDDYLTVSLGTNNRFGWLNKMAGGAQIASYVGTFPDSSDLVTATFTDEASDYRRLKAYGFLYDTEPDIYTFNFQGHSGKFVYDNTSTASVPSFRFLGLTDLKIRIQADDTGNGQGFVITTNDGVEYTFTSAVSQKRSTAALASSVEFLKRDYSLYLHTNGVPDPSYKIEWKLTTVKSPLGATLTYTYALDQQPTTTSLDTVKVSVRNSSGGFTPQNVYTISTTTDQLNLVGISSSTGSSVEFDYLGGGTPRLLSRVVLSDNRRVSSYVKQYNLAYTQTTAGTFTRNFLNTITEVSGCDQMPPYTFSYLTGSSAGQNLPSPSSKNIDFWGYYTYKTNTTLTPSLYYYPLLAPAEQIRLYPIPNYSQTTYSVTDADRTPDAVAMLVGTLNFIQYPSGGYTSLLYEPHQYYDAQSAQTYIGGGLRIKSVTYFDGMNSGTKITKNFVYTDSVGNCTGRLVSRPLFALPMAQYKDPANWSTVINKGTDWTYYIARTEKDISLQETSSGSPVIYQEVKVYRPGSGYARYEYVTPGMYGATASGNWTPTTNKFARATNVGLGPVITSGGPWMFANAPNINFDHERGLVWRKREYNESNAEVRRTRTYYQYLYKSASPYPVTGVRYDYLPNSFDSNTNSNTFFFGKYSLQAEIAKITQMEQVTTFDATSNTKFVVNKTEYAYESNYHRLLTKVKQTAPDSTIYTTRMVYPLDYGTVPANYDTTSQMIAALQVNRNGNPIEQYTTVQRVHDVEKVTGAAVTRFNNFGTASSVLPMKLYSLAMATPLTISSTPSTTTFCVSHLDAVSKTFKIDPHYILNKTYLNYDSYGNAQSSVGSDRIETVTGWGYNKSVPVVTARNTDATQFAFSDFEITRTGLEFTQTQDSCSCGTGYTGGHAFYPATTLTKTVSKANVSNYILSFWIHSNAALSFNVTLRDGNGNTVNHPPAIVFTVPSSGGALFKYFSKTINVANITTPTFSIELQGQSLPAKPANFSAGLLPVIDNVAFYPAGADLSSYTYTFPYGVNAVTSGNQAGFTVFDGLGRQKYTLDTYKNIRSKTTYRFPSDPIPTLVAGIIMPSVVEGTNVFTAVGTNCVDGLTYQWRVDGAIIPNVKSPTLSYPFYDSGPHTISVTVSHPVYGSKSSTPITFNVTMNPCTATICASGASNVNSCTATNTVTTIGTYSCTGVTAPGNSTGTTFAVSSVSVNETITAYQWMTRPTGTNTWTNNGNTSQFVSQKISPGANGFDVQCQITTSSGRTGLSNIMSVTVASTCN